MSGSWAAIDWNFSPPRTQPVMELDYERELFEARGVDAKLASLFDQGVLLAMTLDSTASAVLDLKAIQDTESDKTFKTLSKYKLIFQNMVLQMGRRTPNSESVTLWGATEVLQVGLGELLVVVKGLAKDVHSS